MTMKNSLTTNTINMTSINNRKRILIDEFLSSTDERIKEFHLDDHAIEAIFDCLEHPERDIELFKSILKRLYEIYKSQDRQLRLITLIFVPTLIAIYIRNHHNHSCLHQNKHHHNWNLEKKSSSTSLSSPTPLSPNSSDLELNSSIAILLICVYNFEIIHQKTGDLKTIDVRLISLAKPSIYHEPNVHTSLHSSTVPTEQMLAKINNPNESRITIFGPYHEVEQLNTGNQQSVFTVLMKIYNQHIQEVGYYSLQSMCRLYLSLLKQGSQTAELKQRINKILQQKFNDDDDDHQNDLKNSLIIKPIFLQVSFTSEFLTELMRSAYFCFYNDLEDLSSELIEEISKRATYKFYADVILMVNAFKNTQAIINRDREDHVAKMKKMDQSSQISLNATPPVSMVSSRKAAITNASFKTRKLPDDIPIVTTTTTGTTSQQQLQVQSSIQHHQSNTKLLTPQPRLVQHNKQNGRPIAFNKSLDSINEESSSSPTSNPSNNKNQNAIQSEKQQQQNISNKTPSNQLTSNTTATKPPRKGVIHMLKELKDKPKKSSKVNLNTTTETNGKISNANTLSNQNSITNQNKSKNEEMIPMRYLKNATNSPMDCINNNNNNFVPLARVERFDVDDGNNDNNDADDDDDEMVSATGGDSGDDRNIDERTKLRIEISDMSDTSSAASSSGVALLSNNNSNNNTNGNQSSNLPQVIISDSKYSTPTATAANVVNH